jgi:hypothetical protein
MYFSSRGRHGNVPVRQKTVATARAWMGVSFNSVAQPVVLAVDVTGQAAKKSPESDPGREKGTAAVLAAA